MQARAIARPRTASRARLQLLLLALAAWNLVTFLLVLTGTALVDIERVDGVFGGTAVTGASGVLGVAYIYAARNPVRYRFIVWLALIEQVVALFSMTFHWSRGDISFGEAALPMLVATVFLVLLLITLPRQTDTMTA